MAFREEGVELRCTVNEDNLWIAVKDNLLLAEYEREGVSLCDVSGVVVDAGAHVGVFSLLASVHAPSVVAIEAHPGNYVVLEENVRRNGRENVTVRHSALTATEGQVELVEGPDSASGSVLHERPGRRFSVPSITLDSVIASTGPVDLCKLDIEGAEFDVLDTATDETLGQISALAAELHLEGRHDRLGPVVRRLRALGFRVAVRRPPLHYWAETMRTLWQTRHRLHGEARLRLAVPIVYTLAALGDPVLHARSRLSGELAFLYAARDVRRPSADARGRRR